LIELAKEKGTGLPGAGVLWVRIDYAAWRRFYEWAVVVWKAEMYGGGSVLLTLRMLHYAQNI
jgi:hypothetical protein